GCVPHAAPLTPPPGWVLKTSCVAAPTVMEKEALAAAVNPEEVALSVELPGVATVLQPAKVATPETALFGLAVQVSDAPLPGCVLMANVIEAVELVTVLPPLSLTVTAGCVVQAAPLAPPPGCVLNTS